MNPIHSYAIIGSGLCGLTVAKRLLHNQKFLIEKSKSVGGRMATRRDGDCTYDHGAQYYKNSPSEDFYWNSEWVQKGLATSWFHENSDQYFCGKGGMTSLAKNLATHQTIFFQEKVLSINTDDSEIKIFCESGKIFEPSRVILTLPLPQSLEVLNASRIEYPTELKNIIYAKALVGLVQLEDEPLDNDSKFTYVKPSSAIFSITNNKSKGMCSKIALSVVMNSSWSENNFNHSDEFILTQIRNELNAYFSRNITIKNIQLKKWRFSHPLTQFSHQFCSLENDRIILAGDAFGGASLNGALRSALAVVEYLNKNEFKA